MVEPPGDMLRLSGDCAAIIDKPSGSVSSETVKPSQKNWPRINADESDQEGKTLMLPFSDSRESA